MTFCRTKSTGFSRLTLLPSVREKTCLHHRNTPQCLLPVLSLPCVIVICLKVGMSVFSPLLVLQRAEHLVHSKRRLGPQDYFVPSCPGALPARGCENAPHTKQAHSSLYVLSSASHQALQASYRISQKRIFLSKCPLITHCSVQTMSLQLDPANTVLIPKRKATVINQRQPQGWHIQSCCAPDYQAPKSQTETDRKRQTILTTPVTLRPK